MINLSITLIQDSLDQGKPLREALADMGDSVIACEHFAHLAEEQDKHQNEIIDNGTTDFVTTIVLEPIGVIGGITPWNYPFLMGIWKVVASIAAGCSIVLKVMVHLTFGTLHIFTSWLFKNSVF